MNKGKRHYAESEGDDGIRVKKQTEIVEAIHHNVGTMIIQHTKLIVN